MKEMKKMRKQVSVLLALVMILLSLAPFAEAAVSVGNRVTFGNYRQNTRSSRRTAEPEPISWIVLDTDGSKALLLAEKALVGMPFNSSENYQNEVTWEMCTLRTWLNGEFLNEAFSAAERGSVLETRISTPDYQENGFAVSGGKDTADRVFLLSKEELKRYLRTDASRVCSPTDYAVFTGAGNSWGYYSDDSQHVDHYTNDVCIWWLRSPGKIGHYTAVCSFDGSIGDDGEYSGKGEIAVRPAIWVSVSALNAR